VLEIPEDVIQNMGIHSSIIGEKDDAYYCFSEPVTDEEDEL